MKRLIAIALTLALYSSIAHSSTAAASPVSYRNAVAVIATASSLQELAKLGSEANILIDHPQVGSPIPTVVASDRLATLRAAGLDLAIQPIDLEAVILAERRRIRSASAVFGSFFDDFRSASAIDDYLSTLADLPGAEIVDAGTSTEGRPIRGIRIGSGSSTFVIAAGQHAREWIAPAVAMCLADALARNDDGDASIRELSQRLSIVVVPLVNPDGYEFSRTTNRFWRKNRNGAGVDLNRNWDSMWGLGADTSPGSEVYPGTGAFSEAETKAVRDLVLGEQNVIGFLDYHSPIASILYPFAYTSEPGPQGLMPRQWAEQMAAAISAVYGESHDTRRPGVGNPSGGLAQDWAAGAEAIYAWTPELRGGTFTISPTEIRPACDENLAGFTTLATLVADHVGAGPPDPDAGPNGDGDGDGDGGCSSTGHGKATLLALLALGVLFRRRRSA